MLAIEKRHGMEKSLSYLEGFLDEHELNYKEFIDELVKPKGIVASLLKAFKRLMG